MVARVDSIAGYLIFSIEFCLMRCETNIMQITEKALAKFLQFVQFD